MMYLYLGTEFKIDLDARTSTAFSIEQFTAALEATTTLTTLTVSFDVYEPTPENNRRLVIPLCRCISRLRRHNEHHPLRNLALLHMDLRIHGMFDAFEQVLIAAKQYGIRYLLLHELVCLPIQCLVEFCHNNNNLKVMEVDTVSFSDGRAAMSLPPNRAQDSSVMLAFDRLFLQFLSFEDPASSTAFANFIARMTVRSLYFDRVEAEKSNDEITDRILSEIKFPSVRQLEFNTTIRLQHFKAALEAGTTSLTELVVTTDYDNDDYTERLEMLAHFVFRAVQLSSLTVNISLRPNERVTLPRELLRAIEACATVTRIEMNEDMRRFTTRNEELARFVASPSTYPTDKLLWYMRQFDNCPTGRYMLARSLPGVFSFEKVESTDSTTTEPNPKKRKMS